MTNCSAVAPPLPPGPRPPGLRRPGPLGLPRFGTMPFSEDSDSFRRWHFRGRAHVVPRTRGIAAMRPGHI
eukprot:14137551-Alexandrium_andersonii.AAC.1